MLSTHLAIPFIIPGTLTANAAFRLKLPIDVQLVAVNAACANTTSFGLTIGTAAAAEAYMELTTVTGAAATTTLKKAKEDFVGDQYPHILRDTEIVVGIDYDDGAGGDAAAVCVTLLFTEG